MHTAYSTYTPKHIQAYQPTTKTDILIVFQHPQTMSVSLLMVAALLLTTTPSYNLTQVLEERVFGNVMLYRTTSNITMDPGQVLQTEIVIQCKPTILLWLKTILPRLDVAQAQITTRSTSKTTTVQVSQPDQWVLPAAIDPHTMLKWLLSKPVLVDEGITEIISKQTTNRRVIFTVKKGTCEIRALKHHIPKTILATFNKKPRKKTTTPRKKPTSPKKQQYKEANRC